MAGSIILTNDDGVGAPGLAALVRAFGDRYGERIVVVAPSGDRSAIGHGTTIHSEVRVDCLTGDAFGGGVEAYAVGGTPVDCVKLAVQLLVPQPVALVVAGVNNGYNLGTDVFYSGTVSAAVEAAILGLPGLAVSTGRRGDALNRFADAADASVRLSELILRKPLPARTLLNLNVPAAGQGELPPADICLCRLGERNYKNAYHLARGSGASRYYVLAGEDLDEPGEPGTDIAAVRCGLISISPIHLDRTDHAVLAALEEWLE